MKDKRLILAQEFCQKCYQCPGSPIVCELAYKIADIKLAVSHVQ